MVRSGVALHGAAWHGVERCRKWSMQATWNLTELQRCYVFYRMINITIYLHFGMNGWSSSRKIKFWFFCCSYYCWYQKHNEICIKLKLKVKFQFFSQALLLSDHFKVFFFIAKSHFLMSKEAQSQTLTVCKKGWEDSVMKSNTLSSRLHVFIFTDHALFDVLDFVNLPTSFNVRYVTDWLISIPVTALIMFFALQFRDTSKQIELWPSLAYKTVIHLKHMWQLCNKCMPSLARRRNSKF